MRYVHTDVWLATRINSTFTKSTCWGGDGGAALDRIIRWVTRNEIYQRGRDVCMLGGLQREREREGEGSIYCNVTR